MNAIIEFNAQPLTMSSREIAQLCDKDLAHVHRDVRTMFEQLGDDPELDHVREDKDARGYTACFHLTKSLSMTLVAGYNVKLRKRIIDRWMELEARPAIDPMQVLNDPQAMRGLLLTYTEKVLTLENKVEQLTPKAQALDRIATADGSLCFTDAAKTLQMRLKDLLAC